MAKKTVPLSPTEVKNAKPKDKMYKLSDGDGLRLRIQPNGTKTWLFDYVKPYTRKRSTLSFGSFPDVSLAQARQKRLEARELVAQYIDPKEHKEEQYRASQQANANTLEKVAEDWFAVKKPTIAKTYAEDIWGSLVLHVFPKIGKLPIHKVKATTTIEALKPVAAKGSFETVKRLCQRLNEIMVYAQNSGLIEQNNIAGIKVAFQKPDRKNYPTLKPDELPDFMRSLHTASIKLVTRCLIEWQLHTMTRPSESAGAKWVEIDFENELWTIPPERMKKRREHIIPLTKQCMSLLEVLKPVSGNTEFLFPSDRWTKSGHASESAANVALKRMGYGGRLVAHGMRALASTTLNEEGFDADVIEAALAHADRNTVRAAYNRASYLKRRRKLMDWWSNHIEIASTGNFSLSSGKKGFRLVK